MKKLLIIFLIFGCGFADTVQYRDEILFIKRIKKIDDVKVIKIKKLRNKPYIEFYIRKTALGNRTKWILCEDIISITNENGASIDYNCNTLTINNGNDLTTEIEISKLTQAGNHLVEFKKNYYTGFFISLIGGAIVHYAAKENEGDIMYIGFVTTGLGFFISFLSFNSIGEAGEVLIEADEHINKNKRID